MMASKSRKKSGGSRSSRSRGGGTSVSSGTLIASIIAAFLVGYVVSSFVGGFRLGRDFSGGGSLVDGGPSDRGRGTLFEEAPSRGEYIEALEKKVSENPDDQDLWTELGNAYFDSDQYRSAIDAYQRSLELYSGNANVWTDMGIMYRRIGEYSKALSAFERAIAEDPAHQMSRFNRGIVLFYDLEDRIGAFQAWDELAKMNPDFRTPDGRTIVQMLRDLR
jgi:lipoprotein NlpI